MNTTKIANELTTIAGMVSAGHERKADAETQVFLNVGRYSVEVVVVGIDNRMIASTESYLKSAAEDAGANVQDEHPRSFKPSNRDLSYSGFIAEDEPEYLKDLVRALTAEAKKIKWIEGVSVGNGRWPKVAASSKMARSRKADVDDVRDEFGKDTEELLDDLGIEAEDVTDFSDNVRYYDADYELKAGRMEWIGYKDSNSAEYAAEAYVKEMLDDEPENFTQSWLQYYVGISDTDRRIIAGEDADSYVEDMEDEYLLDEASMLDEHEDEQQKYDDAQDVYDTAVDVSYEDGDDEDKAMDEAQEVMDEAQAAATKAMAELVDKAREAVMEARYDYVYEAMEDPIEYFVKETGIYDVEDLMKANFIYIDTDKAAADAVSQDGAGHFLAGYDNDWVDGPKGTVWFRQN